MDIARTYIDIRVAGWCSAICHVYPDRGPILSVDTSAASLTLSGRTARRNGRAELEFAESLLAAVRTYRDQVEAWVHPAQHTLPLASAGGDPA